MLTSGRDWKGDSGTNTHSAFHANVAVRADVGDEDLETAIHERRERMSPHAQEILMSGMASSEETIKNREERKEETKKLECDVQLMRHL